jgi:DNA-binding GntR family transcriptional regulator
MDRENRGEKSNLRSARARAYMHIHQRITSGQIAGGTAISELTLARELGISRTPIREALTQLAAEGLVEQSPNRRTVVVKLTRQDIIDLYELREALETYAVAKAASYPVRPLDLAKLTSLNNSIRSFQQDLIESGQSALDRAGMARFVAYDLGFHTLLIQLAANNRILKLVNDTRLLIRIFAMRREGHDTALLEKIYQEHAGILQAVVEQDSHRASRLVSEHIQSSLRERLELYDRWEIEASVRDHIPFFFDVMPSAHHSYSEPRSRSK